MPFQSADCAYYADEEERELFDDIATEAAALLAPDSAELEILDDAVHEATHAAAAAAACAWASRERPLMPRTGDVSPLSQLALVAAEEVERATAWIAETAAAAANQAARRSLGLRDDDADCSDGDEQLGAPELELGEYAPPVSGEPSWREWQQDEEGIELQALELALWNELIGTWALAGKLESIDVRQLPSEILALMPPPPEGGWDQRLPSLDGGTIGAPCVLPGPVRRARASYLLTALLPELVESAEQRINLLHTRDVRSRLLLITRELERQRKVLAAVLALRGAMAPGQGGDGAAPGSASGADGPKPQRPGGDKPPSRPSGL